MISKLPRFIPFMIACALIFRNLLEVFGGKMLYEESGIQFVISAPVQIGSIVLVLVGLSIFLKRNIWSYFFLFAIIASFFPFLAFTFFRFDISIGSLKLDMIALSFLITHLILNPYLIRNPIQTKEEELNEYEEKVLSYQKRFEQKSTEELRRMETEDLIPAAAEARERLLKERKD